MIVKDSKTKIYVDAEALVNIMSLLGLNTYDFETIERLLSISDSVNLSQFDLSMWIFIGKCFGCSDNWAIVKYQNYFKENQKL